MHAYCNELTQSKIDSFLQLISIFRAPEDLNLANLQHTAATKLKEYRQVTTLGLQYVIENHNLVDVDIELNSSYVILPHGGELTKSCACAVANLGSIRVKSKPISAETRYHIKSFTSPGCEPGLKHTHFFDTQEPERNNPF